MVDSERPRAWAISCCSAPWCNICAMRSRSSGVRCWAIAGTPFPRAGFARLRPLETPSDVSSYTSFRGSFGKPRLRLRLETAGLPFDERAVVECSHVVVIYGALRKPDRVSFAVWKLVVVREFVPLSHEDRIGVTKPPIIVALDQAPVGIVCEIETVPIEMRMMKEHLPVRRAVAVDRPGGEPAPELHDLPVRHGHVLVQERCRLHAVRGVPVHELEGGDVPAAVGV